MNVSNSSSGTRIAEFQETGIDLYQPLSVDSSGGLSVANGLTLTDSTSNTIDSYSTLYLETSSGSPSDIVLDPSGQVGVESNLNVGGNNISGLDKLKTDGSGNDVISIIDESQDQDIVRFKENGNTEFPRSIEVGDKGGIKISDAGTLAKDSITSSDGLITLKSTNLRADSFGASRNTPLTLKLSQANNRGFILKQGGGQDLLEIPRASEATPRRFTKFIPIDQNLNLYGNTLENVSSLRNGSINNINLAENGDVEVPNGDLNASGNNLSEVSSLQFQDNVTIGDSSTSVTDVGSMAVGRGASVSNFDSIAIGRDASVSGYSSIAIGRDTEIDNRQSVVIGEGVKSTTLKRHVLVGWGTSTGGKSTVAIGYRAKARDNLATVVGANGEAKDKYTTALGAWSEANAVSSIAIGRNADATAKGSVAIGDGANSPNKREATFGNLNGEEMDLNVTGNATVHGSGGLDVGSMMDHTGGALDVKGDVYLQNGREISWENNGYIRHTNNKMLLSGDGLIRLKGNTEFVNLTPHHNKRLQIETDDSSNARPVEIVNGIDGSKIAVFKNNSNIHVPNGNLNVSKGVGDLSGNQRIGFSPGTTNISGGSGPSGAKIQVGLNKIDIQSSTSSRPVEISGGGNDFAIFGHEGTNNLKLNRDLNLSDNGEIDLYGGQIRNSKGQVNIKGNIKLDRGNWIGENSGLRLKVRADQNEMRLNGRLEASEFSSQLNEPLDISLSQGENEQGLVLEEDTGEDLLKIPRADGNPPRRFTKFIPVDQNLNLYGNTLENVSALKNGTQKNIQLTKQGNVKIPNGNLSLDGELKNFFDQSKCDSDEAIKTVYPNGSYACNQLSTTTQAENLSETLAAGNVANQSIRFSAGLGESGIALGTEDSPAKVDATDIAIGAGADADSTSTGSNGIAIGKDTEVVTAGVAIGKNAYSDSNTNAIGIDTSANGIGASAIGWRAEADGAGAIAIGGDTDNDIESGSQKGASATATGAVAIGPDAVARNEYEATFGNLQGQELDVNVTGNLTVHGSGGLDMPNGVVIGDSDTYVGDAGDIAIGEDSGTSDGGEYEVAIGYNALSSTNGVAIGNGTRSINGNSVAIGPSSAAKRSSAVAIGDTAKATGGDAVSIGDSTKAFANSVAIGSNSEAVGRGFANQAVALGAESSATADGAVAIGYDSVSDQQYTVELGSDSQDYDLVVNGNATAEDFISGGADLAEVYSAERDYERGTVVSVSSGESDVEATDERFEDVAGVVSTDPGMVLNREASGIEVALEGRVPVKVAMSVEKGEDLAAGPEGRAVACETSDVELDEDSTKEEIVDAVNSLSSNQECLKASFGTALNSSSGGYVEVKLD